jgi:ribosomal protein L37E
VNTANPAGRPEPGPYRGARVAVGTRHGKQHQFAGPFRRELGAELVVPDDLDTDRFGTFCGRTPRRGGAAEAARAKAHLAIEATGLAFGLASEASYGALTGAGFPGHEEILLFCDTRLGIEVLEGHRTWSMPPAGRSVGEAGEIPAALTAGLPRQALIVRSADPVDPARAVVVKGITTTPELHRAVAAAVAGSADGRAVVEPDLRAHHNPSRRAVLRELASRMARRLTARCAACGTPGFGRVDAETGLPCRACGTPTPLLHAEIHGCAACGHRVRRPAAAVWADPGSCPECNP